MALLQLPLTSSSLGPFTLGDSLFETLSELRGVEGRRAYGQVAIAFNDKDPATGPVLLTLLPASLSLQLVFAGPSQLLAEISLPTLAPLSLSPPAGVTLTSGSDVLVGQGTGPLTKRDVSRIFGPTFDTPSTRFGAGRPSDNAAGVEVWYPGLGFGFGPSPASAGTGEPDICRQIWICDRSRRPVVAGPEVQPAPADESMPSRSVRPGALVKALINMSTSSVRLSFTPGARPEQPTTDVQAQIVTVTVRVGETTTADLLTELGAPSQTFEKVDDRLGIHRTAAGAGGESEDEGVGGVGQLYFWNYFHLGLDVLILPTAAGHIAHKLVLHSNLPGANQWGRYERCPWALATPTGTEVDVRTPVETILRTLSAPSLLAAPAKSGVLAHVIYPSSSSKSKAAKPSKTSPSPSPSPPSTQPPGIGQTPPIESTRHSFEPEEALRRSMPLDRTLDGSWGAGVLLGGSAGREGGGRLVAAGTGCVLEVIGEGWIEGIVIF